VVRPLGSSFNTIKYFALGLKTSTSSRNRCFQIVCEFELKYSVFRAAESSVNLSLDIELPWTTVVARGLMISNFVVPVGRVLAASSLVPKDRKIFGI
jgi:hypothetical protein